MMRDVTGIGRYMLTDTEAQEGGQRELVVVRSITGLPKGSASEALSTQEDQTPVIQEGAQNN